MEKNKSFSNRKSTNFNFFNINLIIIGIFLFTLFFSVIKSFIRFELSFLLLLFSIIILLFSKLINKNGIAITKVDLMWLLFLMCFIINIAFNGLFTPNNMIDILVYTLAIMFLLLVKVNINYYDSSLKLIKILGIVYACSAIFQYLFTDIYLGNVLPLFLESEQSGILSLLRGNSYSGFTNQTAHLAGYTVSAIGVIVFSKWNSKFSTKVYTNMFLILLFIGLLLSSKRAHIIFMIIAIVITILFSINNKAFVKNITKLILGIILLGLLTIILYMSIDNEDSPIVGIFNDIEDTIIGFIEGDDITSGRSILYRHSLELFKDNSIAGIGWKEFLNSNSIGLINSDRGSHPHNIYLQLLTELGMMGFLLFIIPVVYMYYKTFRMLRLLSIQNGSLEKWKKGIQFSFFSQTFFLLYGLTGNLLTDFNFLLTYFFACSISLSAMVKLKPDQLSLVE